MRCFRSKRWSGRCVRVWLGTAVVCGSVGAGVACGWGQQGSTPSLHQRSEMNQDQSEADANRAIDAAQEPSSLPDDVGDRTSSITAMILSNWIWTTTD